MPSPFFDRSLRALFALLHLFRKCDFAAVNQGLDVAEREPERARDRVVFHVVEVSKCQDRPRPFRKFRKRFAQFALGLAAEDPARWIRLFSGIRECVLERLFLGQLLSLRPS